MNRLAQPWVLNSLAGALNFCVFMADLSPIRWANLAVAPVSFWVAWKVRHLRVG